MNRQDAEKWASAIKYSSRPDVSRQDLIDKLLEEFNAPSSVRCHVCESPLNGDTCPKCQPEAPPDVSALRFEGKEVEIAEPKKRCPVLKNELAIDEEGGKILGVRKVQFPNSWPPCWILRIKEQPPQPRRWIVEEAASRNSYWDSLGLPGALGKSAHVKIAAPRPLADLDNPKVLALCVEASVDAGMAGGGRTAQCRAAIQAYLAMEPAK